MARALFALGRLLAALRITRPVAILLLVSFIALFVITIGLYWSFLEAGDIPTWGDIVVFTVISLVVFAVVSLSGWLAFSARGRALLFESAEPPVKRPRLVRLFKIFLASAAMALGILMILEVLVLFLQGPEWITATNRSWGFYLLMVLCFPIAYKWLD